MLQEPCRLPPPSAPTLLSRVSPPHRLPCSCSSRQELESRSLSPLREPVQEQERHDQQVGGWVGWLGRASLGCACEWDLGHSDCGFRLGVNDGFLPFQARAPLRERRGGVGRDHYECPCGDPTNTKSTQRLTHPPRLLLLHLAAETLLEAVQCSVLRHLDGCEVVLLSVWWAREYIASSSFEGSEMKQQKQERMCVCVCVYVRARARVCVCM